MKRASTTLALTVVAALGLSACTGTEPQPTPTPTVTVAPSGDGVLRIGTAFNLKKSSKASGAAQVAGVELAVRDINLAGGVNGAPVEVFHRDGADAASFPALVEKGVDVVIGASSAARADEFAPLATEAGIPVISAAAAFSEPTPFTFSTAPSRAGIIMGIVDGLVAADIANVAIVRFDGDAYASLEYDLNAALRDADITSGAVHPFGADGADAELVVLEVTKLKPGAVIFAGPANSESSAIIAALNEAGHGGAQLWFAGEAVRQWKKPVAAGSLEGAHGVTRGSSTDVAFASLLKQTDPSLSSTEFAAEAYDATVLAALAATLAGDDGGPSIAHNLRAASAGGIQCSSFAECLDVLATESDIDYVGRSGPTDFDDDGNGGALSYVSYVFSEANKPTLVAK